MSELPLVTAVVPVHNNRATLGTCLEALAASSYRRMEIVVADNASTDGSAEAAMDAAAKGGAHAPAIRVVRSDRNLWCGGGKNLGVAHAKGEYIFFTDSDVVVAPDTVERLVEQLRARPELAAVFGSYTPSTPLRDFFSRYKNLVHHFTHQTSPPRALTFWGGCGMVRRAVFERLGGFSPTLRFITDIEFGYRLCAAGEAVWLDRGVQVVHLKRYTLRSLMGSDFRARAVPWTKVLLDRRVVARHLNLRWSNLVSGVACWLGVLAAAAAAAFAALDRESWNGWARQAPIALAGAALVLFVVYAVANRDFFALAWREGGPGFLLRVIGFHFVYYVYATAGFAYGAAAYLAGRLRRGAEAVA